MKPLTAKAVATLQVLKRGESFYVDAENFSDDYELESLRYSLHHQARIHQKRINTARQTGGLRIWLV